MNKQSYKQITIIITQSNRLNQRDVAVIPALLQNPRFPNNNPLSQLPENALIAMSEDRTNIETAIAMPTRQPRLLELLGFVQITVCLKQKGRDICMNSIANLDNQTAQLNSSDKRRMKFEQKRKCINFYLKSFDVFEENVKDKLISLVNKLEYAEL